MIEMARIRLHGFSDREIGQARASMMSDVESAYIEPRPGITHRLAVLTSCKLTMHLSVHLSVWVVEVKGFLGNEQGV